jgi:type IV pilus assembly protein PilB
MAKHIRLGDLLVEGGKLTETQLMDALSKQKSSGRKLGEILVDDGYVTEKDILETIEVQLGIPFINFSEINIDNKVVKTVPEKLARKYTLVPVALEGEELTIAMADPLNIFAIDDVKMTTGLKIQTAIGRSDQIMDTINKVYSIQSVKKTLPQANDLDISEVDSSPIVQMVNEMIKEAVRKKASDIHIEPFEDFVRVRYRVDGVLREVARHNKANHPAIITRIKIMSTLDIAEKRIPQDGRIELNIEGADIDLRVSVLPTIYGEKIVMRLLNRSSFLLTKQQLGFNQHNLEMFENIVKSSNGIILVTGPTGSGKTTTLYAVLRELNTISKNIVTIEDPIEYRLSGINQVQVNNKAGMTFARGLRSILRQDPNIVMIGEIRDQETAEIAIRAAVTGHLVLSTIHTNDAPSTISRLLDMDIEPYLLASSLVGITAQRLVRRICPECKEEYFASIEEASLLNISVGTKLYRGKGCSSCSKSGYKGRAGVHEILPINSELRELIGQRASVSTIMEKGKELGMITLQENAKDLVLNGVSTVEEWLRVTYSIG